MKVVEEITQAISINVPTISKQIRSNLNKWLRKQNNPEIIRLQEEREYSVSVNSNTEDPKDKRRHDLDDDKQKVRWYTIVPTIVS